MVDSPLCSFCAKEEETLEHLLFQCIHVQAFWFAIESFLTSKDIYNKALSELDVLLGIFGEDKNLTLINFTIIIAKRYIYFCRAKSIKPMTKYSLFWKRVQNAYKIEFAIATKRKKLDSHYYKWEILLPLLQS